MKTENEIKLSEFIENPDNPQTITDEAFERLIEKIKRVPDGLTAKRIAYIVDQQSGKKIIIAGNKRLRALKIIRGTDGSCPADWFQDVTWMSEDQRREFIINSNVCEGKWVAQLLLSMMSKDELKELMDEQDVIEILADIPSNQQIAENQEIATGEFVDDMELKLKLSKEDGEIALRVLRSVNQENLGAALMSIIDGGVE